MAKKNHKQNSSTAYLSKRALVRATGKATRSISTQAMNLRGYIVQAENGWVVKIDDSGKREQLVKLGRANAQRKIALD